MASNGAGSTLYYQWYENTVNNNTGGTPIPVATSISYTPQNTTVGITYYCVVTQPASGCESVSVTAEVDIVPGPTFTTQPQDDQASTVGAVISALGISYTNGSGSPQYQWYENTVNNNTTGTPIPGAISAVVILPSTAVAGTTYYYCTVDLPQGWM